MADKTTVRTRKQNPKAAPYTPTAIVKALTGTGVLPAGPAYAVDTLDEILRTLLIGKDLATVFYATALTSTGITTNLTASQFSRMQAALTTEIAHANLLRSHLSTFQKTSIFDPYQFFYLPASAFTSLSATNDWASGDPLYNEPLPQVLSNAQFIDLLEVLESGMVSAEDAAIYQLTALAWNSGSYPYKIPYAPVVSNYPGVAELMASLEGVEFGHLTLANELDVAFWGDSQFVNDEDDFIHVFDSLVHGNYPAMTALLPFVQRNYSTTYYPYYFTSPLATFSNAGWQPYSLQTAMQHATGLTLSAINDTESYF